MSALLLLLLTYSTLLARAQEGCQKAPLWLFFRHEDVQTIYPSLPDIFILVDGGEVDQLVTSADPTVAELFFLPTSVAEFPVNWCISSDAFEVLTYSLSLRSLNPSVLEHPEASIPPQGTITSQPYRFRIMLKCLDDSPTNPYVQVNITLSSSITATNFCPVVFYFARDCQGAEPDEIPTELASVGITDGYLDFNATFKDPLPSVDTLSSTRLSIILPAVILPLVVITLIPLGIILSLWLVWYRRKSKAIARFELEDISTAYRQVYNPWTKRGPHDKEFPPENIKLARELGEGAFGVVYQAEALGILSNEHEWTDVAVKQLRPGSNEADDFFREVDFMSKLDHPNVVKLLGVCSLEEPFSMVFEYMDLGDLCGFLREAVGLGKDDDDKEGEGENPGNQEEDKFDEPLLTKEELLVIVKQIAEGMVYISSLHLVHRDLATRNCLVATGLVVKIGDFGMSRNVNESDYYRVHGSALLPVRWMSPESILYGKFTTETDIWAFGILLWEVFTFGQQPYFGLQNEEVIQLIQKGSHPEPPEDCCTYQLMMQCWERNPKKRPDFSSLTDSIQQLVEQCQQQNE